MTVFSCFYCETKEEGPKDGAPPRWSCIARTSESGFSTFVYICPFCSDTIRRRKG